MITCSVFIATSLDGFIARQDGDFAWLDTSAPQIEGEDYGFAEFYASIDALVMGRKTYETALGFPEWPYAGKRLAVLSSSSIVIPLHLKKDVQQMNATPREVVRQLEFTGANHLYVDGGLTIQGFLRAGLIDDMTITAIPILLGSGIPLFGPLEHDIRLLVITSRAYSNGFVQTKYRVVPSN